MNPVLLGTILKSDGVIFNAKHYGNVSVIVNHINENYTPAEPVTEQDVLAALKKITTSDGASER